ncbi:HPr family phosphocarrier protein [Caproiciproducens faecalis]|uniref:HPr family phosphocarrier protein n=1 Tax=Caproiciproducens faecalis TaxID=2820301 RepID=A0ABS7DM66_9FIRM|nr:HPr family phosphocarrier protein [Caproiciproducens faecalis]MBW7572385.1 HPr family phosphocarrier protein [Caproiciproducens faecalis]
MKQFTYTVTDPEGIHARPAGLLVKAASAFASDIQVVKNGTAANAKKIFAVMGLAVKKGESVTVTAQGGDEEKATETLLAFFKANL